MFRDCFDKDSSLYSLTAKNPNTCVNAIACGQEIEERLLVLLTFVNVYHSRVCTSLLVVKKITTLHKNLEIDNSSVEEIEFQIFGAYLHF